MKLFKKLIFIFLSIGALISCDGMDATYKEFIEEGPIVYIGKVDSLKAYAGRNRVMGYPKILSEAERGNFALTNRAATSHCNCP